VRYFTFLRTGLEVLHLGAQNSQSNAWPIEHWRVNKGRWRLFTPAIDSYLNANLKDLSFGKSVETFVLYLEVADFGIWGGPPAFHGPEGRVTYKHSVREIRSVGQIDWLAVQYLSPTQQLAMYRKALVESIAKIAKANRKQKEFSASLFSAEVESLLRRSKVSKFARNASN
jgi:hypothetical protein